MLGGSGYVGSRVVATGGAGGVDIAAVTMPRIGATSRCDVSTAVDSWRAGHAEAFTQLCRDFEPFEIVINAAGAASPRSNDVALLFGANVVLPMVAAQAAEAAGVRRFVHVSSAAVQGRSDPLDETCNVYPLTPYGSTKAEGERALLQACGEPYGSRSPLDIVIYRPTSVHGLGQDATETLARLVARLPAIPVRGTGDQELPVALIENVAAGIVFAGTAGVPGPILLQPSEEVTARLLVEFFGATRIIGLPATASKVVLDQLVKHAAGHPRVEGHLRWLEIMFGGQAVKATTLSEAGFQPPIGHEGWRALADSVRQPKAPVK